MKSKTNKPEVGESLLYFLVWSMALLVPILNSQMMSEDHIYLVNLLLVWSKLLPYIIIFIINNRVLLPRLLLRGHRVVYILVSLVMLTIVFYSLEYWLDALQSLTFENNVEYVIQGRASFTDLAWYWNVLLGMFMFGANCGIKLMFKSIQDEQRMVELERHSLKAEMDYLKYQVNPHFFMNTLNNIHALIDIDSEAAKDTVIELSKMMRYVLYDSEKSQISLDKDMDFVENYIALMQIRYTNMVEIKVDIERPIPVGVCVPPLLFIVFVENAFKHGVSYTEPSFVHIKLRNEQGSAFFEVRNSRHKSTTVEKGGLGLENVRKRLDLLFGSDYTLTIDQSIENEYSVNLKIPVIYDKMHNHR